MSDKFPPKNSGFRLETFRFPSDVTPCRHAIYHHGCPSCDERDPEGDDNDLVVGAPTREAEAVHIPSDPDERAALAEMAGLTADERRALDQWCHLMAIERAAQRRRARQSSEWAMP